MPVWLPSSVKPTITYIPRRRRSPCRPSRPETDPAAGGLDLADKPPVDREYLQAGICDESVDGQERSVRDQIRVRVHGELVELSFRGDRRRVQGGKPSRRAKIDGPGPGIDRDALDVVVDEFPRRALDRIGGKRLRPVGRIQYHTLGSGHPLLIERVDGYCVHCQAVRRPVCRNPAGPQGIGGIKYDGDPPVGPDPDFVVLVDHDRGSIVARQSVCACKVDCRDAVDRPAVGERHDPFELWILDDSPEIVRTVHREAPVDGSVLEDADSCGVDENGDVAPGPVGSADSQDISIGGGDDGHPEVAVAVACDAARDEEVGVVRKPYIPTLRPKMWRCR